MAILVRKRQNGKQKREHIPMTSFKYVFQSAIASLLDAIRVLPSEGVLKDILDFDIEDIEDHQSMNRVISSIRFE
jgi:hypothetical protein